MRRLFIFLLACAGFLAAEVVHAQSCSVALQVTYPDGTKGCLTDLPIGKAIPKMWGRPISQLVNSSSFYVVAASASCPDVAYNQANNSSQARIQNTELRALEACPKECACAVVIRDGSVLVPRTLAMALGSEASSLPQASAVNAEQENKLKQQEQENQLAQQRLQEQKQQDISRAQERERQQQEAVRRQQEQLAQAQQLKAQQRLEEEARLMEQVRKEQALKAREEALLAQEARFREQLRQAEEARLKEEERQLQARKREEEARKTAQTQTNSDRELLLQLAAELAKLRAQQTEQDKKSAATTPVANAAPPSPPRPEPLPVFANRKALVIGNDHYKYVSTLNNASEDARAMAENLKSVGYQVVLKLDVTEKEFKASLRQFRNQVETGDEVAFFYAGHGVQLNNSNYLVPVDVAGESEEQLRDEAIPLQRFLDDMSEKRVKFSLAMIDACRDNPFKNQGRSLGGGTRGLAPTTAATGQMVVFSAGTGQQALDKLGPGDKDKNGVFTRIFIREMQKPGVSVDRVVRSVRTEVVNLAKSIGHDQVPAIYDQTVGEFYFRAR